MLEMVKKTTVNRELSNNKAVLDQTGLRGLIIFNRINEYEMSKRDDDVIMYPSERIPHVRDAGVARSNCAVPTTFILIALSPFSPALHRYSDFNRPLTYFAIAGAAVNPGLSIPSK
jgi:hypothetical protein